jgi:hypothetical protein
VIDHESSSEDERCRESKDRMDQRVENCRYNKRGRAEVRWQSTEVGKAASCRPGCRSEDEADREVLALQLSVGAMW